MIPSLHAGTIGFSTSERYLAGIAQRTFLGFWSHPNLFRSRAKELADLVVIFGDDIVVFSDKSCEYKDGAHGWSRWYRRAILDSAHQLHRAAGWIRQHPSEIYMDAKCERRFPFPVPASPNVHLVAVATGARQAAEQHFGGDGSLILHTHSDGSEKFIVGDLDRSKDFVHVFDDLTLSAVLGELDTVSDFVAYLRKRAAFLRSGPEIYAHSEFDLLAYYLKAMVGDEHDFVVPPHDPPATAIAIEDDWNELVTSASYQRKKAADADSYLWDRIIEDVAHHADRGTLETGQELGLVGNEELMRVLATENRFARRQLSRALIGARQLGAAGSENTHVRTVLSGKVTDRTYVFCVVRRDRETGDNYRKARRAMLWARIEITKLRRQELRSIVGIAVAPSDDPDQSVDVMIQEFPDPWPVEARQVAERLCDELGVSRETVGLETRLQDHEFPAPHVSSNRAPRPQRRDMKAAARAKRKTQRAARKRNR